MLALGWLAALITAAGCQSGAGRPGVEAEALQAGPATVGPHPADQLAAAKRMFYDAVAGQDGALRSSTALLERLGGETSQDPQVIAYLGGCRLLAAPGAVLPWEMGRLSKEGLALQDRAVAAAPDDLEIRALRGLSNYQLPGFFGRGMVAAEDLAFAAPRAPAAVRAGALEPRIGAAVLYHHGLVLGRSGDRPSAEAAWREAVAVSPDSPAGRAAAKQLGQRQ